MALTKEHELTTSTDLNRSEGIMNDLLQKQPWAHDRLLDLVAYNEVMYRAIGIEA